MFERMKIVPVSQLRAIGVRWFIVGLLAGAGLAWIAQRAWAEILAPRPPAVTQVGEHAVIVRFTALRDGEPVHCTLSMHWRTKAWTLTC